MSLYSIFAAQAKARGDAPAIITGAGRVVSYGDLAAGAMRRAAHLAQLGVGVGDRVLIARGVSPALYESVLAVFALGGVAVFPEPAAGLAGVRHAVRATQPKAICVGRLGLVLFALVPGLRGVICRSVAAGWAGGLLSAMTAWLGLKHGVRTQGVRTQGPCEYDGGDGVLPVLDDDAPALITFTSGSTGVPKGVVRSVGFLLLQHRLIEGVRRTQASDVDLISLPVFILSNLAAGATSVLPDGPMTRPAAMDGRRLSAQIHRHGVTRVMVPPAVCEALLSLGVGSGSGSRSGSGSGAFPGLTDVFTGGGPVFPNVLRGLARLAPHARVLAAYGSTEAEPVAHVSVGEISDADWADMAAGKGLLAGHPIDEIAVDLVDGEVWVAGAHVNAGYLDPADDASTKRVRDGVIWHRTGDAARMDDCGRLWLLGRYGEGQHHAVGHGMRSGEETALFPFAVETAARSWPGVKAAAFVVMQGRCGGDGRGPDTSQTSEASVTEGRAVLALSGVGLDVADLRARAAALGAMEVVCLQAIPMDTRHNSKVNYPVLRRVLSEILPV